MESVLEVPPAGAPLEAQQSYLKLLTEAFRRTHTFADKLVDIAGSTSVNTQARRAAGGACGWGGGLECRCRWEGWLHGRGEGLQGVVPALSLLPALQRICNSAFPLVALHVLKRCWTVSHRS